MTKVLWCNGPGCALPRPAEWAPFLELQGPRFEWTWAKGRSRFARAPYERRAVSTRVNSVQNNDPGILDPVSEKRLI